MLLAEPIQITHRLVQEFERLGIQYLVGGSLASSLHGISRATNGTVRCPLGTEQEVAQYLESKNQQWFSRSVIRVTEKLTSMTTPPATDQPAPRSD